MSELDDAIEIITEGGTALGVSCEDVYERMMTNRLFMLKILEGVHSGVDVTPKFMASFELVAQKLLLSAQRANEEVGNGLL
jgi:hypothetical protein